MEILRFSNGDIMHFLGGCQKKMENAKYRWNSYVVVTEAYDLVMIYNTFTGFIASMKPIEYRKACNIENIQYVYELIENYCIVPEEYNEYELTMLYRERRQRPITCTTLSSLSSYTIFTTMKCNAHCFYCYENPVKGKSNMTLETAEKVVKYILETSYQNVNLDLGWFGGEPTYNSEIIDYITDKLIENERTFGSTMISNSYLFGDEEFVKKAVDKWHLTMVQVTLDGMDEVYNKTKKYIYKDDPNPFRTVIKAIHNLLNYGIRVSVRLNCDLYNIEEITKVIEFISEEFTPNPLFSAYIWPIFELNGYKRTEEQRKELFSKLDELNQLLKENDLMQDGVSDHGIKYELCMIDNGNNVTILPDGKLGLCEHHIDSDFIGTIDDPYNLDRELMKKYREHVSHDKICEQCPLLPICLKSPKCPSAPLCDEYEKTYKINKAKKELQIFWKNWQFNKNNNCNCENNNCCNNCHENQNN